MACRRTTRSGAILTLSLILVAGWDGRVLGQSGGGFSGTSSTGTGATTVGGGFTGGGGSSGGGYTGGTATGTGAQATPGGFTGGSTTGSSLGFTGTGAMTSNSGTAVPSAVNPFISTYTNAYGAGLLNTSGQTMINSYFGQPLYSTYSTAISGSTSSGTTGGLRGGTGGAGGIGGMGGMSSTASTSNFGFNTFGMSRTPYYAATLADDMPRGVIANPQLQANVADVLRRSTYVQTTTPLKVAVKDATVYLEGAVPTAKQKRLIEGLVRLTPGVQGVVNNLEVTETLPPPTKGGAKIGP